jgi:hypothetical protein
VLVIIGMPLPWLKVGGLVLSAQTANGFEGAGVVTFLAAVAMLALIVLPYTTKTRRVAIDRAVSYLALLLVGIAAMGAELLTLIGTEGSSLAPMDAPGLWLALAGMAVATWGVLELLAERPTTS